ncbi:MAG: phosphoribosylformylglycinamidine synthase [Gammaproteobacteria bacterium]
MKRTSAYLGASALEEVERKIGAERLRTLRRNENFAVCEVFFAAFVEPSTANTGGEELLRYLIGATADFFPRKITGDTALVVPHPRTNSPWSSKARDLLHNCGLKEISYLERGFCFHNGGNTADLFADRMTQTVLRPEKTGKWLSIFDRLVDSRSMPARISIKNLDKINKEFGLALNENEIAHLRKLCAALGRDLTEAELMMFAQANSEHCRHKIFRAADAGGGKSMMDLIRQTHAAAPDGVITAFADNAAVVCAAAGEDFAPDENGVFRRGTGGLYLVAKAETHNHPTAISPFPGAATGSGGEIRDEAAAGRGAASRAGFAGFAVSRLAAADLPARHAPSSHFASPLEIMIEGPLGTANYCNEFGRPSLGGFFRTFESAAKAESVSPRRLGFHKPLMLAGGLGHMRAGGEGKKAIPPGAKIIQLGGPGFRIGMGGGAASSRVSGGDDFASVQRGNAEMQRRAQEVIDACRRISGGMFLSLHDVGAGGLGNAVIEMAHDGGAGARISLAAIPVEDRSLSPAEIWCNEAQERFVLALDADYLEKFSAICKRENCPFAVLGEATADGKIVVLDENGEAVADLPLAEILDNVPLPPLVVENFAEEFLEDSEQAEISAAENFSDNAPKPKPENSAAVESLESAPPKNPPQKTETEKRTPQADLLADLCRAVLRHPAVGSKRFLISIGDRTVGGLTARDQMVGPWQIPAADCAAFFNDYESFGGAVFALGERPGVAALNPAAGARIAVAEALANLAGAGVGGLARVKFSLNWLANCADAKRAGELRAAVCAAADFCRELQTGVIVGKDSLFMRAKTDGDAAADAEVESPAFPVAAAFAPHDDVRRVLTPQLSGRADTFLMLAEPSGRRRLGGSVWAEITGVAAPPPDISAAAMESFWRAIAACHERGLLLAYHDRSDGGLWAAACESAFAANCGVSLILDGLFPAAQTDGGENACGGDIAAALFCEETGALLEVAPQNAPAVLEIFADAGLAQNIQTAGRAAADGKIRLYRNSKILFEETLDELRREWETVSYEIARRRDCPECAAEEYGRDPAAVQLFARPPPEYKTADWKNAPFSIGGARPRLAVLREQGSNGQREMAAAFTRAGFDAADIAMEDLRAGTRLDEFAGIALCGGFSFGDVLGAGRGWAEGVLQNPRLAEMFSAFFAAPNTFAFGACNGCQALALLRPLMPEADSWRFPRFAQNRSRRFEARLVMTEILKTDSPLFAGMEGAFLPAVSSNAEGRAVFGGENLDGKNGAEKTLRAPPVLRFADGNGAPAAKYPQNPAGGEGGFCGFCSPDGRVTITMPHPERTFRCAQLSWRPPEWTDDASPWMQLFINARRFAD